MEELKLQLTSEVKNIQQRLLMPMNTQPKNSRQLSKVLASFLDSVAVVETLAEYKYLTSILKSFEVSFKTRVVRNRKRKTPTQYHIVLLEKWD